MPSKTTFIFDRSHLFQVGQIKMLNQLTIEVPRTLPFDEQGLPFQVYGPSKTLYLPVDIPLSKSFPPRRHTDRSFSASSSYTHETAEASSASSFTDSLRSKSDTWQAPRRREEQEAATPRTSRSVDTKELRKRPKSPVPERPVTPATPRGTLRPVDASSDVIPAIRFEGPCFHGLPCPPPSDQKPVQSPLTRHRATVPLIQPSSPVLARRPCPPLIERNSALTRSCEYPLKSPPREESPEAAAETTGEERHHRRVKTFPSPTSGPALSPPARSVLRQSAESSPSGNRASPVPCALQAFPQREALQASTRRVSRSPSVLGKPVASFSPQTPLDNFALEPPALRLPSSSTGQSFDTRQLGTLHPVTAPGPETDDLGDFGFWSPRAVVRKLERRR